MNISQHTVLSTSFSLSPTGYWRNLFDSVSGLFYPFYVPIFGFDGSVVTEIRSKQVIQLSNVQRVSVLTQEHDYFNGPQPYGLFINIF